MIKQDPVCMFVNIEVYLLHFCYRDKLTKSAKFRVRVFRTDLFQPIMPVTGPAQGEGLGGL